VHSQQRSTTAQLQKLAPTHLGQSSKHQQNSTGKHHAIPHYIHLVQRYQSAKQARKASQHHTQVQLYKSLVSLVHIIKFSAAKIIKIPVPIVPFVTKLRLLPQKCLVVSSAITIFAAQKV
jgi:hypothetical protein